MFMGKLGTNIYHCKNKNPPSAFETMNRKDGAENKNKTVIGRKPIGHIKLGLRSFFYFLGHTNCFSRLNAEYCKYRQEEMKSNNID
jgi:hypothetical protein